VAQYFHISNEQCGYYLILASVICTVTSTTYGNEYCCQEVSLADQTVVIRVEPVCSQLRGGRANGRNANTAQPHNLIPMSSHL
jgi:hypothetical protein